MQRVIDIDEDLAVSLDHNDAVLAGRSDESDTGVLIYGIGPPRPRFNDLTETERTQPCNRPGIPVERVEHFLRLAAQPAQCGFMQVVFVRMRDQINGGFRSRIRVRRFWKHVPLIAKRRSVKPW